MFHANQFYGKYRETKREWGKILKTGQNLLRAHHFLPFFPGNVILFTYVQFTRSHLYIQPNTASEKESRAETSHFIISNGNCTQHSLARLLDALDVLKVAVAAREAQHCARWTRPLNQYSQYMAYTALHYFWVLFSQIVKAAQTVSRVDKHDFPCDKQTLQLFLFEPTRLYNCISCATEKGPLPLLSRDKLKKMEIASWCLT